jgi:hypothetical protein
MNPQVWRGTREQFEDKPEWRTTLQREGGKVSFILEGAGPFKGNYYEYAEDVYPVDVANPGGKPKADSSRLHEEVEAGKVQILKGKLP